MISELVPHTWVSAFASSVRSEAAFLAMLYSDLGVDDGEVLGSKAQDGMEVFDGMKVQDGEKVQDGLMVHDGMKLQDGLLVQDGLMVHGGMKAQDSKKAYDGDHLHEGRNGVSMEQVCVGMVGMSMEQEEQERVEANVREETEALFLEVHGRKAQDNKKFEDGTVKAKESMKVEDGMVRNGATQASDEEEREFDEGDFELPHELYEDVDKTHSKLKKLKQRVDGIERGMEMVIGGLGWFMTEVTSQIKEVVNTMKEACKEDLSELSERLRKLEKDGGPGAPQSSVLLSHVRQVSGKGGCNGMRSVGNCDDCDQRCGHCSECLHGNVCRKRLDVQHCVCDGHCGCHSVPRRYIRTDCGCKVRMD